MKRYDTFWLRIGACFLDGLIFGILNWLQETFQNEYTPHWITIVWSLVHSLGPIAYSVLMHARFGQTLGKMAMGVVVLDISETKIVNLRQSCLRDIGLIIPELIGIIYWLANSIFKFGGDPSQIFLGVFGLTSLIWMLLEVTTMLTNSKRRAFHDWIAGSVVVRKDD